MKDLRGTMRGRMEVKFVCRGCGFTESIDYQTNIASDAVRTMAKTCPRCSTERAA